MDKLRHGLESMHSSCPSSPQALLMLGVRGPASSGLVSIAWHTDQLLQHQWGPHVTTWLSSITVDWVIMPSRNKQDQDPPATRLRESDQVCTAAVRNGNFKPPCVAASTSQHDSFVHDHTTTMQIDSYLHGNLPLPQTHRFEHFLENIVR